MKDWSKYNPGIFQYKGKWVKNWFSNMEESPFYLETTNITYKTVEHFYQAMKTDSMLEHALIATAETPQEAKQLGKTASLVKDWEDKKIEVMRIGLLMKFSIPEWRDKLLATGNETIIEWNNWGDREWGVDIRDSKGNNRLGLLLMEIREEIKTKNKDIQS